MGEGHVLGREQNQEADQWSPGLRDQGRCWVRAEQPGRLERAGRKVMTKTDPLPGTQTLARRTKRGV